MKLPEKMPRPLREDYEALLQGFLSQNYSSVTFTNFTGRDRELLLRHDIDYSLEHAVRLAQVEKKLGLVSTFYVLVTCPFYNVLSPDNQDRLRQILNAGHTIGLHLDLQSPMGTQDLNALAIKQAAILEAACNIEIDTLSFHRPGTLLKGKAYNEIMFDGFVSAYEDRFFKDIAYVSDSRGGWHYGHPFNHPSFESGKPFQLLTHPMWWASGNHDSPGALMHSQIQSASLETRKLAFQEFSITDGDINSK